MLPYCTLWRNTIQCNISLYFMLCYFMLQHVAQGHVVLHYYTNCTIQKNWHIIFISVSLNQLMVGVSLTASEQRACLHLTVIWPTDTDSACTAVCGGSCFEAISDRHGKEETGDSVTSFKSYDSLMCTIGVVWQYNTQACSESGQGDICRTPDTSYMIIILQLSGQQYISPNYC